jgi:DNA-binding HxlR family transcriptional regulator/putative sterol carrier protein
MRSRSYKQFCALAYALDIVGERWTLLIIRELLSGPRRYKDLIDGLPGISTNLLCDRLEGLEQQGILIRRVLPPPAGSAVYELTPSGQALEKAAVELGRWGSHFLPASLEGVALPSAGAMALAMKAFFQPERARGVHETYELHLGHEVLQVQPHGDELRVQQGQARQADVVFRMDMATYLGLFTGQIEPDEAIARGVIRIEGDPAALNRLLNVCRVSGTVE